MQRIHARHAEISNNNIKLRANRSTSGIYAEYSLVESNYILLSDGSNCNSIDTGYYGLVQIILYMLLEIKEGLLGDTDLKYRIILFMQPTAEKAHFTQRKGRSIIQTGTGLFVGS